MGNREQDIAKKGYPPETGGSTATSSPSVTGSAPVTGSPFNHTRQIWSCSANAVP